MWKSVLVALFIIGCGGSQSNKDSTIKPSSAEEIDLNGDGTRMRGSILSELMAN